MADRRPVEPTVETRSAHLQISPASSPPLTAEVASSFFIEVVLQYDGDSPLYWAPEAPIRLAYRWLRPDTQEAFVADGMRTDVGLFIAPGEKRVVRARIFAPEGPETAILRVSCIAESYFWFCDRFPTGWFDLPIEIVPAGHWPEQLRRSPAAKALRGALSANVLRQSIGRASFVSGFVRNSQIDAQQQLMVETTAPPEPPRQIIPQIEPFDVSLPPFPAAPTRMSERPAEVDLQPDPLPAGWGGRAARSLDKMVASTTFGAAIDRIARQGDQIAASLDRYVSEQDLRDFAQQGRVEWLESALRETVRGIEQLSSHCVTLERRQIATEGHLAASEARVVTNIDELAKGLTAQLSTIVSDAASFGSRLDQTYARLVKLIEDSAEQADQVMLNARRANELLRSCRDDVRQLALGQHSVSESVAAIDGRVATLSGQNFAGMAELLEALLENRRATAANLESIGTRIARVGEKGDARTSAVIARIDEASNAVSKKMNDSLAREAVGFRSRVTDFGGEISRKLERSLAALLVDIGKSGDARLATLSEDSVSSLAKLLEPFFESQRIAEKNLDAIRVLIAGPGEIVDARASTVMARIDEASNAVSKKMNDSLAREGAGFRSRVNDLGGEISRKLERSLAALLVDIGKSGDARLATLSEDSVSSLAKLLEPFFEGQRVAEKGFDAMRAHIAMLGEVSDARASNLMARIEETGQAVTAKLSDSLAREGVGFRTGVGDLSADISRNLDRALASLSAEINEAMNARIATLGDESASGLAERLKPIFENQRTTSMNLDSIRAHIASLGEKSDARALQLLARIEEASHGVTDRLNASLAEEGIGIRTEVGDLSADVRRNIDEAVKNLVAQFNETANTSAIGTSVGQILDNAAAEAVIIRNISDKVDHLLWRQVFAVDAQKMTFCRNSWGLFGIPEHDVEAIAYYASGTVPEPGTMNLVDTLLGPGMTFIDVGANIGLFTIAAARRVGPTGKVISFEPDRTTAAALATTIRVNGVEPIVTLHNCAAGSHSEQRILYLGRTSGHNSLVKLSDIDATVEVDVKTLDEIVGTDPVHVVKIDVEGWELHVLAGANTLIKNNPDAYFILEFGPSHLVRSGDTIDHWLRTIEDLGFTVFEIDEDAITVRPLRASGLDEVVSINLLLAKSLPSTVQIG